MKKIVLVLGFSYYTFIVFFFLFYTGCKSDFINSPNNIEPLPDTLGNVVGYLNSLEGPVENAYIFLDEKSTFSDSAGFFEFRNVKKQQSVITISNPEFDTYMNTIDITDSLVLNVELTRIKYDYLPLKVGNHWRYHWTSGWYASGGGGGHSTGTMDWKIESVVGIYPSYTFNIKETRYDSSDNSSSERFFSLRTNSSDSLELIGNSYLIRTSKIKRFYNITFGDTVYNFLPYDNYTLKLKRNIGAIQCHYGMTGITFGSSTNYEILNYTIN